MNVLEFILLVSMGIVVLAVGTDIGTQIWAEKRAERQAQWARIREAEAILYNSIAKRFEARELTEVAIIELNVVSLHEKPAKGRHRLSAA